MAGAVWSVGVASTIPVGHSQTRRGWVATAELHPDDLPRHAVDDRVQIDPAVLGDPHAHHVHVRVA
jgi:hypothetical protein